MKEESASYGVQVPCFIRFGDCTEHAAHLVQCYFFIDGSGLLGCSADACGLFIRSRAWSA